MDVHKIIKLFFPTLKPGTVVSAPETNKAGLLLHRQPGFACFSPCHLIPPCNRFVFPPLLTTQYNMIGFWAIWQIAASSQGDKSRHEEAIAGAFSRGAPECCGSDLHAAAAAGGGMGEGYGVHPPTREAGAVISPADIEFCHKICDNRLIALGNNGKTNNISMLDNQWKKGHGRKKDSGYRGQ